MTAINTKNKSVSPSKKKKVAPNARRPRRQVQLIKSPMPTASENCALHYLLARGDPFHPLAAGVCLPCGTGQPSFKATVRINGIAKPYSTGLIGIKFNMTPCFDRPCITVTNGTTAPATTWPSSHWSATNAAFTDYTDLKQPYGHLHLANADVEWRPVACGLRVRAVGPPLSAGGIMYGYVIPDGGGTTSDFMAEAPSLAATRSLPLRSNEWLQLNQDFGHLSNNETYTTNEFWVGANVSTCTGFVFAQPSSPDSILEFQYVLHYEMVGSSAGSLKTKSYVNPQLAQQVMSAAANVSQMPPPNGSSKDTFAQTISEFAAEVGQVAGGVGKAIAGISSLVAAVSAAS
jgi:hypothetical protein